MDELYTLERQEALRRAEYEARHAQALRRAEYETRATQSLARASKSLTTSPVGTPFFEHQHLNDRGYFGESNARSESAWRDEQSDTEETEMDIDRRAKPRRRSSVPWQGLPMGIMFSNSSPDIGGLRQAGPSSRTNSGDHHAHDLTPTSAAYPLHKSHERHHSQASHHPGSLAPYPPRSHDSPSPPSSGSDSELAAIHMHAHARSHSEYRPHAVGPAHSAAVSRASYTPSTSPFLSPMRGLNLHSANPSRAPSPVQLPPPSMELPPRPTFSRQNSSDGPYSSHGYGGYGHSSYDRTLPPLPTPQLSSGPSSGDSSPNLPIAVPAQQPVRVPSTTGYASAGSSRAGSPLSWAAHAVGRDREKEIVHSHHHHASASTNHPGHHHPYFDTSTHKGGDNHRHLAHSVRVAFGMTPIHASGGGGTHSPPLSRSTGSGRGYSHHRTQPHSPSSTGAPNTPWMSAKSMPASRAHSPPITLAPLVGSAMEAEEARHSFIPLDDTSCADVKVELPTFRQFEASTRHSSPESNAMAIDI